MTRLYEHQVGRGVAREESFFRKPKKKQHKTGFVSSFTLRDILRRRSEHLRTEEFDVQGCIISPIIIVCALATFRCRQGNIFDIHK
jgi:hypothetical protein